jgi:DNA-binding response OmpR family regulator
MPHILVVDDEPSVALSLQRLLQQAGYQVEVAHSGQTALDALAGADFDLVLLDLNLGDPLVDGLEVCRAVRARPDYLPVIMLTVRESAQDTVIGLEVGADDYVTKPYDERELLARIRARLRSAAAAGHNRQAATLIIDDHLHIDAKRRRVFRDKTEIALTRREFDLLLYLATNAGRAFGRAMLLDQVWGWAYAGDTRTVDKHMAELRRKIEVDPATPHYLLTVWGVGYAFCEW